MVSDIRITNIYYYDFICWIWHKNKVIKNLIYCLFLIKFLLFYSYFYFLIILIMIFIINSFLSVFKIFWFPIVFNRIFNNLSVIILYFSVCISGVFLIYLLLISVIIYYMIFLVFIVGTCFLIIWLEFWLVLRYYYR